MADTHKFTCDMSANDNLDGFTDFKPKARYERSFLLAPRRVDILGPDFELIGKNLLSCVKLLSGHWGMIYTIYFE